MKNKTFTLLTAVHPSNEVVTQKVILPIDTKVLSAIEAGSNASLSYVYGNYPTENKTLATKQEYTFLVIPYNIVSPISYEMDEDYVHLADVRMHGTGFAIYYKVGGLVEE